MKVQKRTVLFLIVVVIGMGLLWGCEEEGLPEGKRDRLVALENMELKKELKAHENEIAEQKESLASCMEEREALLEQRQQDLQVIMSGLLEKGITEENARLVKENQELKVRVAELEEQLSSQ